MSWFEDWFDTSLYETLYASRDFAEAEQMADLINGEFPASSFKTVLDLACGRGRHSLNLARRGYDVLGVDLAPSAIKKASSLIPVDLEDKMAFQVHDMRKPLDRKFDLIVNLFTSFGYFESDDENRQVLRNIQEMLKDGGGFVIDFLSAPYVRKNLVKSESQRFDDYTVDITRVINEEKRMVQKTMHFHTGSKSAEFTERVKLFDEAWFRSELAALGFSIRGVYGDYEGGSYKNEESPRLIIFAAKE